MIRLAGLVTLCVLLGACSLGRQTAYRMADTLILSTADDYLDLNREQKKMAGSALEEMFLWHRKEELPRIAELFRQASKDAADGISESEIDRYTKKATERFQVAALRLLPPTATLLASLSEAQISHMEKETAEKQKDRFERLDGTERDAILHTQKRVEKNYKEWVGSLTPPQVQQVEQFAKEIFPIQKLRQKLTPARNKRFADLLRSKRPARELEKDLHALILEPKEKETLEWWSLEEKEGQMRQALQKSILTTLSPKQLGEFRRNLEAWADDAEELAKISDP